RVTGFPEWDGFPLRDALTERLGAPVVVDKDTNAAALGLAVGGEGGGEGGSFAYLHLGTGLGAGLVIGGACTGGRGPARASSGTRSCSSTGRAAPAATAAASRRSAWTRWPGATLRRRPACSAPAPRTSSDCWTSTASCSAAGRSRPPRTSSPAGS